MTEGIGDNINELLSTTEKKKIGEYNKAKDGQIKAYHTIFFESVVGQENVPVDKYRVFEAAMQCNMGLSKGTESELELRSRR
jgi:hypothetical protein